MIGPVREDPPLAVRRFRHRQTGEEALLSVSISHPPGGPTHTVKVTRPDGITTVANIMYATEALFRDQAREVWAQRERELKAAGYVREE
jgi:hypothetical protein